MENYSAGIKGAFRPVDRTGQLLPVRAEFGHASCECGQTTDPLSEAADFTSAGRVTPADEGCQPGRALGERLVGEM